MGTAIQKHQEAGKEIVSLNIDDLDVVDLERRLEMAVALATLGCTSDCPCNCPHLVSCGTYCA
jgi:hypothetical protein